MLSERKCSASYGNFMEIHSFRRFSGDLAETLWKLRVSTKYPHQEIQRNNEILCSVRIVDLVRMMCLLLFRTLLFVLTVKSAFLQISVDKNDSSYLSFLKFYVVFEYSPTIERNHYIKVIYDVTSSPFLLNGKIRKYIEIRNFDTEFIQKAIASF